MKTKGALFLIVLFAGLFVIIFTLSHMFIHTGHQYFNYFFVALEGGVIGWLVNRLMNK